MGWFNGKTTVCFEIPDDQYRVIETLFDMAAKENPDFDKDAWFSELIGAWIQSNWRGTIKKMAFTGSNPERKKERVARK